MVSNLFLLMVSFAAAKPVVELKSHLGYTHDISAKNIAKWKKTTQMLESGVPIKKKQYADGFDEMMDGPWSTISSGCSWYCGGWPDKMEASSILPNQGKNSHGAKMAHDSDIRTAWVEGDSDHGKGASIQFSFDSNGQEMNQIIIWNGYQKSPAFYKKNSRPKTLILHINDVPTYSLQLQDTLAAQYFDIKPLVMPGEKTTTLRFEVAAVYPGSKWKDTAISEINFNGPSH